MNPDPHQSAGRVSPEILPPGLIVPMLTPLTPAGEIDEHSARCLTEYLITEGADALFLLGSTGEGDSLSLRAQYRFAELIAQWTRGRVPLLLGALQPSTRLVIDFVKGCPCIDAFGAAVVGVPYYRFVKCKAEVLAHFERVHDAVGKPVVV